MRTQHLLLLSLSLAVALANSACSSLHHATTPPPPAPEVGPVSKPAPSTDSGASTSANPGNSALSANAMAGNNAANTSSTSSKADSSAAADLSQRSVHFDYDQAGLHSADLPLLSAHAAWLAAHPNSKARLEGNCDERGTREYNMALGERRAKAVLFFMKAHGVQASQLSVVSYGKEKPIDAGHDEAAWSRNRRVDIDYQVGAP